MSTSATPDEQRLTALYSTYATRVYAYVRRNVKSHTAEEIASETFLVAWRKLDSIPGDPLPWLLVVARNLIGNHWQALARQERTREELAALQRVLPTAPPLDETVAHRSELLRALRALSELEREALLLTGWDGLTDTQAAQVCGCSPRTFRVRLHRARQRLERELAAPDENAGREQLPRSLDTLLEDHT